MTGTPIPSIAKLLPDSDRHGVFNGWDVLKLLALALMLLDHLGVLFFPETPLLRALGRGAAPVFLWLVGAAPSQRLRPDLLAAGLALAAVEWAVTGRLLPLNILFAIMAARLVLRHLEKPPYAPLHVWEWWLGLLVLLPFSELLVDFGTLGLMLVLCGHLQRRAADYAPAQRRQFTLLAWGTYLLIQWVELALPLGAGIIAAAGTGAVFYLLSRFTLRPVRVHPRWRRWAIAGRWLARRSLYLYALHLALLLLLAGPPKPPAW